VRSGVIPGPTSNSLREGIVFDWKESGSESHGFENDGNRIPKTTNHRAARRIQAVSPATESAPRLEKAGAWRLGLPRPVSSALCLKSTYRLSLCSHPSQLVFYDNRDPCLSILKICGSSASLPRP
jgi:hypothetical protein